MDGHKKGGKPLSGAAFFLSAIWLVNDACLELVHRICGATCQQGLLTQEVLFVVIAHV